MREKLGPQNLPPNGFEVDDARRAYDRCLWLEKRNEWSEFPRSEDILVMGDLTPEVAARVLGWGLRFSPSEGARNALTY